MGKGSEGEERRAARNYLSRWSSLLYWFEKAPPPKMRAGREDGPVPVVVFREWTIRIGVAVDISDWTPYQS